MVHTKLFDKDTTGIVKVMDEGRTIFIDEDSLVLKNQEVVFEFEPKSDQLNYGVVLRYSSPKDYILIGPTAHNNERDFTYWHVITPNESHLVAEDAIRIFARREVPYKVRIRLIENRITVYLDGAAIYIGELPGLTTQPGKVGFFVESDTSIKVTHLSQEEASPIEYIDSATIVEETISSEVLTVKVDKDFPRVIEYTLESASTTGQARPIHIVEINNKPYHPVVTSVKNKEGNQITYTLSVAKLNITFDVVFQVIKNVLDMRIMNIQDEAYPIYTFNFPEHSLVSMSSGTPNAEMRVNDYRHETIVDLTSVKPENTYKVTSIIVLSNDTIAATINNGSIKNRAELAYQTFQVGDQTSTGAWSNEYLYRGMDGEIIEEPWTKVAITLDRNQDGKIDFQDGAIARREDTCKDSHHKKRIGADFVTSAIGMIGMNVGSEAQYPFLRILDNMKKVSLGTDGFSQNLIVKGYQSEGHDASHPEYTKYNKHAGGLEDLNILLEEARKFNSRVGVHINHRDIYPESYLFQEKASSIDAWAWYDCAKHIIRENDLLDKSEDGYEARFSKLVEDTKGYLGMVYVDVYFGTRWPMHKIVKSINDAGYPVGTEFIDEMVRYSTWAHHIDQRYNTPGNLVRFISHDQQDIFGNSPLFRGARTRTTSDVGINGWQLASNYNEFIEAFYQDILPNKYLAQFPISQYESEERVVLGYNNEVVSEIIEGRNIITKDGKKIVDHTTLFIPWDAKTEEKIYHWNAVGGITTWELPNSWKEIEKVYVYPLTDEGRGNCVMIDVILGKVTIDARPKQAYIVCQVASDSGVIHAHTMEWSTGSPVKDMGFDSHSFIHWNRSSSSTSLEHIQMINNERGNTVLKISGTEDGKVMQTLTGLIPGQSYSASVFAQVEGGKTAIIEIINGNETLFNYMEVSNYTYGIHHSDKYGTKAQRMGVHFVAKDTTATLVLKAAATEDTKAWAIFDDVRVMKNTPSKKHKDYLYFEDFENVDQGHGVFVSNESDYSHLAERNRSNPECTVNDVISGDFSLKVQNGEYFRTLPHTVRFEPHTKYEIGIKYKTNVVGGLRVSVSTDEGHKRIATQVSDKGDHEEGKILLEFMTDEFKDYFVEVEQEKPGTNYILDDFYVRIVT